MPRNFRKDWHFRKDWRGRKGPGPRLANRVEKQSSGKEIISKIKERLLSGQVIFMREGTRQESYFTDYLSNADLEISDRLLKGHISGSG